jgi:DNA transformation protein
VVSKTSVNALPGIGPVTQGWLDEAGIGTIDALKSMGAVEAYRRLKFMFPRNVTLNALYGLEAALRGCHWADLPSDVRAMLQEQAEVIDQALRKGPPTRCNLR